MLRIRERRAAALNAMGRVEESLSDYQEAIRIAGGLGDQQMVLNCLASIPAVIVHTTLNDKLPEYCEQGLELARTQEDKDIESRITGERRQPFGLRLREMPQ